MKSKTQKSQDLKKLKEKLPKSTITVFTTFSRAHSADSTSSRQAGEKGLSVAQMRELKKSLQDSTYFVTKKSLIEKALKDLKYDGIDVYNISGSMGLVFSEGDAYAVSKKLYEFAKKNPALQFFGALLRQGYEGQAQFMDKDAFLEIAKMPSREVLIARLLGMMKYPVSSLTVVLNEIAKKEEIAV